MFHLLSFVWEQRLGEMRRAQNICTIKGFIEENDWWKEVGVEEAAVVGGK